MSWLFFLVRKEIVVVVDFIIKEKVNLTRSSHIMRDFTEEIIN